jgi:zinc protease
MDRAQTHLVLGWPAPDMKSPDRYALEVLDRVLSGQGGRLFVKLRDEQSLAYSLSSFYSAGLDVGAFGLYIGFDPAKLEQVEKGFQEIVADLKAKPVSAEELQGAKENILGSYEIGLQSYDAQASEATFNVLYGLGLDYRDRYLAGIQAVTAEDVRKAAEKYLDMDRAVKVTVGPGD